MEEGRLTTLVVEVEIVVDVTTALVVAVTTMSEVTPVVRVPTYDVTLVAAVAVNVLVDVKLELNEVKVVVAVVEKVVVAEAVCPSTAAGAVKLNARPKTAAKLNKNIKGKIRRADSLNRTSSSDPSRPWSVRPQSTRERLHQSRLR